MIKKLVGLSLFLFMAPILYAGPLGPASGPPYVPDNVILNQKSQQNGKTFNVSSATVANLITSTITTNSLTIAGVVISTSIRSGTTVYPATATASFPFGYTASTATFTGVVNGTTVTITGLFTGATIHGSSMVITGTITGSNVTGTNSGDVTIGTGNGLSVSGQALSLALSNTTSTGSLTSTNWNTFNNKLATNGNGSALTGLTKTQVGLDQVENVDQTDADNITSGMVGTAYLGSGTASSQRYLRGDQSWQLLNSTAVGLGSVTNNAQVKISDYTQKGGMLVGIAPGVFSLLAPGSNNTILRSNSAKAEGMEWVGFSSFTFTDGVTASTITATVYVTSPQGIFSTVTSTTVNSTVVNASTVTVSSLTVSNLSGVLKATTGLVFGSATTTDVPEGSNLYYTVARSTSLISANAPITYSNGAIGIDGSFISTTTAASTYLTQSSATATYLTLSSAATQAANYIRTTSSLQSGATIYLTSGTIQGLQVSSISIGNQLQHVNSIVNVKDVAYGAKGDGSTNDTTAIQAAITFVSNHGGGKVFFPAGVYIVNPLTIPDYIQLEGQGAKSTELSFSIAASTAIQLGSSTDVKILNIKLLNSSTGNTSRAIYGQTIREFRLDDYEIEGFYDGLVFDEPVNCIIGQGRWVGVSIGSGTCITLGNIASGFSATTDDIENAYCSTYSTGVYIQSGNTNRIRSNFETLQKPIVTNTPSGLNSRTYVYGAHFESNASNAILLTALGDSEIFASGLIAYEGTYVTDWGPRISGRVTIMTNDQIITSTATALQIGHKVQTNAGNMSFQNEKGLQALDPTGTTLLPLLRIDSSSHTTISANSQSFRVEGASTTIAIGANGSATAPTANPVGYIYFQIGGTDRIIPYYTKP